MPGDGTQKPGPGAHSPEKVRMCNALDKQTSMYLTNNNLNSKKSFFKLLYFINF